MSFVRWLPLWLGVVLPGCPTAPTEPPPPARSLEIAPAPPRALGALAAGTDAAPRPDVTPGVEAEPTLPSPPGAGALPDAGAPAPGTDAAPAAPPDAGMAL